MGFEIGGSWTASTSAESNGNRRMSIAATPDPKPLTGMRILVAEDSWHLAMALRQTLEQAGAIVPNMAGTVAQAERLTRTLDFDAAVMDLNLHDEMTTTLVTRLAEQGKKIIVISGYEVAPDLARKVHACLAKPATGEALITALLRPLQAG